MRTQVMIISTDAVFSRMLELEFRLRRITAAVRAEADGSEADVVLLDLDTATPPPSECYRHMIGFTRASVLAGDEALRACSLILRRPFEMRQLRDEVLTLLDETVETEKTHDVYAKTDDMGQGSDCTVRLSDGRVVRLAPREYAVFSLLKAHRGEPVSREAIAEVIGESSANKVDVYVCYLRKKLETPTRRLIKTVRGAGYCLL